MFPLFMASLLIAFLVCSYILLSRDFSFDAAKKLLIEEGGAEGWFETHGLETTPNPNDSGTLRGTSPDGLVSVEIDVPSFSELTPKSNVTITLDIGDSVLSHVDIGQLDETNRYTSRHLDLYRGTANGVVALEEDEESTLLALATGLPDVIATIRRLVEPGSMLIESDERTLTMTFGAHILSPMNFGGHKPKSILFLFDTLRMAIHEPVDHATLLVSMLMRHAPRGHNTSAATLAWDIANLMCAKYRDSDAIKELDTLLDSTEPLTQAACIRWGGYEGGPFARPPAKRVAALRYVCEDISIGGDVRRHLTRELAWYSLLDEDLPAFVRMDAANHAFGSPDAPSSPRERDEALATLFASKQSSKSLAFAIVFDALIAHGWSPSPDGVHLLVMNGSQSLYPKILDFIENRTSRRDYANSLVALKRAGYPRAAKLFDGLELSDVAGRLSLSSDDTSKGALSSAGARGALSDANSE